MRKRLGKIKNEALERRYRRKLSIRNKVKGTDERPRISITKTNKHLRIQVIDDDKSNTLFSVQTYGKNAVGKAGNVSDAKLVGVEVAKKMKSLKLKLGVLDRSGFKYSGVIAALANSIRENGVQI